TTLAVGASCTVNVVFAPTTVVSFSRTLNVAGDNGLAVTPASVTLTGTGVAPPTFTATVSPNPLAFPDTMTGATGAAQSLTLTNTGNSALSGLSFTFGAGAPQPFARATAVQGGAGSCGTTLAVGASCTVNVVFAPTTVVSFSRTLNVAGDNGLAVTPASVTLTGTGVAPPTFTATVSPNPLAFPDTMTGTTGAAQSLTLTNTGNSALSGLTFTFGAGAPQQFARATATPGRACSCRTTLAVGASCTVNVVFAPTTATLFSRTLTVAGNNGLKVTPASVTLTAAGVAARAPMAISPSPLTITLPAANLNMTGTGVVTLKNSAPAGGSQAAVTGLAVSGGSATTYFFNLVAGSDNCTGATLAPGASCTVTVRFTNVGSPRGATRNGAMTFTDTGAGSPQSRPLRGYATP